MLRYAMLRCVMLRYAVLCYAMLCHAMDATVQGHRNTKEQRRSQNKGPGFRCTPTQVMYAMYVLYVMYAMYVM